MHPRTPWSVLSNREVASAGKNALLSDPPCSISSESTIEEVVSQAEASIIMFE